MEMDRSHLMLVVGFLLLGWVLARRTIVQRRRLARDARASERAAGKAERFGKRQQTERSAVPLSGAPVETQRWQVAMFELQRELKAELDTRIAIVQSLLRQVDQRIEQLAQQPASGAPPVRGPSSPAPTADATAQQRVGELADQGHRAPEIAEHLGRPLAEVEQILAARDRTGR